MATIHAFRYRSDETLTAVTAINEEISGAIFREPLLSLLGTVLVEGEAELRASIAYHETDSLTSLSDELDQKFNTNFTIFRNTSETLAAASALGAQAEAAAKVTAVIETHGRNLHQKSKGDQISLFDNIVTELDIENEEAPINSAMLRPLFDAVLANHTELKEVEKTRKSETATGSFVPAPSDVAKGLHSTMNHIHNYLSVMVEYGSERYEKPLAAINARLAPIVAQVKSRITRSKNSAE